MVLLSSGRPIAGLTSGKLTPTGARSLRLDRYAIAPGVEVTGSLDAGGSGFPLSFKGKLIVSGGHAAPGTVSVKGNLISGTLAGTHVSQHG
jgi:hypothetical protein